MEIHFLKPDEYIIKDTGVIYTVLGSCIAIILWDKKTKISGMVHYRMADIKNNSLMTITGKYLAEKMYNEIINLGISPKNLKGKIVGGKEFEGIFAKEIVDGNINFAVKFLKEKNIIIEELRIKYKNPLRIRFFTETGILKIIEIV